MCNSEKEFAFVDTYSTRSVVTCERRPKGSRRVIQARFPESLVNVIGYKNNMGGSDSYDFMKSIARLHEFVTLILICLIRVTLSRIHFLAFERS